MDGEKMHFGGRKRGRGEKSSFSSRFTLLGYITKKVKKEKG